MSTKAFIALLVGVLVVGIGMGGTFIGGLLVGRSQVAEPAQAVPQGALTAASTQQSFGALTQEQRDQLRQRFQGQLSPDEGTQGFAGGSLAGGGRGLRGAIEKIEGNTLTVNTAQGPLQTTVTSETVIRQVAQVTINELLAGMEVTVVGAPGEDGAVEARTIVVVPEGQGDLASGGGFFGGRRQPGQQVP